MTPHDAEPIWTDLATLRCTLAPDPVPTDGGGSTRILVVRLDNPAGDLVDTAVFAELDVLGRRLATSTAIGGVVITGREPGIFAPHFRLGEIAEGAEALGRPVPYGLARLAFTGVAALSRSRRVRDALLASPAAGIAELARTHAALDRLGTLPQVVVAAIDGDALAGGCELALACDLRVMARGEGRIGLVEITAAIPPGAGGTQRLARAVGHAQARSMMLRATTYDADEARAAGLVDEVTAPDDVLATAIAVATEVARRSPDAVAAVKRSLAGGRAWRSGVADEAASFVSTASRTRAIARLKDFAALSDQRGTRTPWRNRTWIS
ncbi:enoyl-CoA hydratase/isomerase family protein [Longivirga aurantiaca]|uniref:Enoyl-CoA hydratase/isomerase family protein n=1 Tax=Longivirga aurantiaca TaxID=1837743 RepID=A0ABW1T3B9_9ACTN